MPAQESHTEGWLVSPAKSGIFFFGHPIKILLEVLNNDFSLVVCL